MPSISIKEKDLSWYYRQRETSDLTIYVPLLAGFGPYEPVLVDQSNFTSVFGDSSVGVKDDISYKMAASFVSSGANVIGHRFETDGPAKAGSSYYHVSYNAPTEDVVVAFPSAEDSNKYTVLAGSTEVDIAGDAFQEDAVRAAFVAKGLTVTGVSYYTVTYESDNNPIEVKISAKYDGSFGNKLGLTANYIAPYLYVKAYDMVSGSTVESVRVTLSDPDSPYYYEWVNDTTSFIEVRPSNEYLAYYTATWTGATSDTTEVVLNGKTYTIPQGASSFNFNSLPYGFSSETIAEALVTAEVVSSAESVTVTQGILSYTESDKLSGGSDGDRSTAYSTVCRRIVDSTALNDLLDPYQYSFNIVTNGGFNTYGDQIISTFDPESWELRFSRVLPQSIQVTGPTSEVITIPQGVIKYHLSSSWTKAQATTFNSSTQAALNVVLPSGTSALTAVDTVLTDLAYGSGKAIYLVDGYKDWSPTEFYYYLRNFENQLKNSYVAAYGPWGRAQFVSDGSTALLPGSYALLVSWAQSLASGTPLWMAPAGVKRAQLGSFYKSPKYQIGKTELDEWQNNDNINDMTFKVNPIMRMKQYGYCINGASTLLSRRPDGSTSQLQSVSVRVLCNMIKEQAFDISLGLQFDKINDDLIAQFKALMGTFMDQLRYGGALYDYEIVADRTTITFADLNQRRVPVKIRISPNPDAENFDITLEVSQAGISFADETDENEVG